VIRGNLATRPFYNERAAHLAIALFALAVLALTAFNVYRLVSLSSRNTALDSEIRQDEETAERVRREAAALRARVNQVELQAVIAGAREANALIDQRTFSWTEFFNLIERTLPSDVMLAAVRPTIDENRTIVHMTVIGRRAEDIDEFMEQLEGTKAFRSVQPVSEDVTEDGLHRLALTTEYLAAEAQEGEAASGGPGAPAEP
jgi:hypothetical protein